MTNGMKPWKMGDFLSVKHGYPFQSEHFATEGHYVVVTPGNFYEAGGFKRIPGKEKYFTAQFPAEYLLKKGDLVVAMTQQTAGLLGSTAIIPADDEYLHNQRIGLISFDETVVDKLYLYYLFMSRSVRKQIEDSASGTKIKHTSPDKIYGVIVYLPDIVIQKSVGKLLWALEQKITNNTCIATELESMEKTLYDYWFVQFDFPDANGKPYRASGGEMVWNEQLKREIPEGWIVQPLSYYLDCNKHTIKRNEWKCDIEYLDTGSLTSNRIGELQRYETIDAAPSRAQRIVHSNDILYSTVRPNQCHYGLIKTPFPNLVASSGFACLASKFGAEYNDLFYAFLSSTRIVERLTSIAASSVSAYPSINPNDIMELLIVLPERLETIRAMSDRLCELFSAVAHYQTENHELSQLRNWLLPMLMNGQATVTSAEPTPKLQVLVPEKPARDPRFDRWLQTQGVAARGTVDKQTLNDIFDAMDDDDKQ